jgi:hypothetical protein
VERQALESSAANFPYLQGLWTVLFGFGMMIAGVSNLHQVPAMTWGAGIVGGGFLLCAVAGLGISRYYRDNFGLVVPTRGRKTRQAIANVTWIAVLFAGASRLLFWSSHSSFCVFATAFALGALAYYAILVGLRAHHVAIWGALVVAGLLPIWGGLGQDRDALAMLPLGMALIASGLFDHRLLVRSLNSAQTLDIEKSNVGE